MISERRLAIYLSCAKSTSKLQQCSEALLACVRAQERGSGTGQPMAAQEGAAGTTNTLMRVRYADVDDSNFKLPVPLIVGLAAAVVGFVALCLYLRWLCTRRRRRREASSSSAAATALTPVPAGLDADAINGLPVTLYSPARSTSTEEKGVDGEREAECSICITALVAGDKVKALPPCGHCFHPDCVDAWLRSQPSCPLCRTLLLTAAAKPVDVVNGSDEESPV